MTYRISRLSTRGQARRRRPAASDAGVPLERLIRLEQDLAAACRAAIEHLFDTDIKAVLHRFAADHTRRAAELTPQLEALGGMVPVTDKTNSVFTVSDIRLAALLGDTTILKVLLKKQTEMLDEYESSAAQSDLSPMLLAKLDESRRNEKEHIETLELYSPEALSL